MAFRSLSYDSRSLALIDRYETRYERQYMRCHRRFLEVRALRTPPSAPPPPTPEKKTPVSKRTGN